MQQSLNSIKNHQAAIKPRSTNRSLLQNLLSGDFLEPLLSDFQIIFERDPAARNWLEVVFCYPG